MSLARTMVESLLRVGSVATESSPSLRVMHFNILASAYETGFPACSPEFQAFSYRMPRVLSILQICEPDIVSLVEVDHVDQYGPRFEELGYKFHFLKKPQHGADGTALLWRPSTGISIAANFENVMYPGCNQSCLIGSFSVRGRPLCVMATHLKAGRDQDSEDKRAHQCEVLYRVASEKTAQSVPCLVVGDFNSCPEGNGYVPKVYPYLSARMDSAMTLLLGHELDVSTCKMREGRLICETIDYMWVMGKGSERASPSLIPLRGLDAPSREQLQASNGLPNENFPSDHVHLVVDFLMQ